jgi:hypothetical protein
MLSYITLALALISLVAAWRASRRNGELQERIDRVNSRLYHLRRELQEAHEANELKITHLKFQLLQLKGELKITDEMTIGDILMLHPQARDVLAGFHLGGCSSCVVDTKQTLAEAAAVNGRELVPIVVALNNLVVKATNGDTHLPSEKCKTPNVQLHF